MLGWNFYINNILVDEPIGWDGIEFTFKRSQNFYGLENTFSKFDLQFDGNAAKLINDEFAQNGFDGVLDFKIEDICDNNKIATTIWQINLMFYSKTNGIVSVSVSETGFSQKLKNRLDLEVSLDSLTSIGGTSLFPPNYKTIGLHSKSIKREGKMDFEKLPYQNHFHFNGNTEVAFGYLFPIPFNRLITDLDTFNLPGLDAFVNDTSNYDIFQPSAAVFTAPYGGNYKFKIHIHAQVSTSRHSLSVLRLKVGTNVGSASRKTDNLDSFATTGSQFFNLDYDNDGYEITFYPGESLWIYIDTKFQTTTNPDIDYLLGFVSANNYIAFEDLNQFAAPSDCKAMLIHDVFSRMCEILTDEKLCFKSEFFGLTDQYPFYSEDGCGSHTAITNGKNLRNMLQKDGTSFPISLSFTDLFKSCDAIWNIGMRIEYTAYGKGIVRIEPKSFFFRRDSISLFMDHVANITVTPATNYVFKGVTIGFEKWNLNTGSINGIDEFNTVHNYTLPVQNAKENLELKSKYIASGYIIELTRRVQYQSNPSTDFETDDNVFFICLNDKEISSDIYSQDHSVQTYKANTVSETKEHFPIVENFLSPESAYNLRLSPGRSLLRWWNFISASLFYKIREDYFTKIKFQSGEGNVKMISTQEGDCKETLKSFAEDQDIQEATLDMPQTLFAPVFFTFDYPISFHAYNEIRNNSNLGIQFNCDGITALVGFLEELKYKPAGPQNGVGTFTLLIDAATGGAFSDGFSQGFNI